MDTDVRRWIETSASLGKASRLAAVVHALYRAMLRFGSRSEASLLRLRRLEADGMSLRGGALEPALACFDAVLALEPNRITSLRPAGRLLMKAHRYEDARPYWERLARVAADDAEPHLQLGRIHGKARRYVEAAAEARAALALSPGNTAVYDLCVRIEAVRRRSDAAPSSASVDAAEAEPSMVESLMNQARRQARDAELGGFLETLNGLMALTGPSAGLVALAREHRHVIERAGDARLLALVSEGGTAVDACSDLVAGPTISREADVHLAMHVRELIGGLLHGHIGQVVLMVDRLAALSATEDRTRRVLGCYATEVLECLQRNRGALAPAETIDLEARLAKAYADDAWVIQAMAAQRETEGSQREALALFRDLADSASGAGAALLHAATLAGGLGAWDEALSFAKRAVAIAGDDRPLISDIGALFVENNRAADAVTCWRIADAAGQPRLWVRQGIVRCLEKTLDDDARSHEALRCLRDALPLADLTAAEQNYLIDIVRHLVQAHASPRCAPAMAEIADTRTILMASEAPSALREWIAASFDLARPDYRAALRHLDDGLAEQPIQDMVALDLHAEKALIYQRYALYGEAVGELALVPPQTLAVSSHYRRSFELPRQVAALCADAAHPMRYPECLFDIIFEEIANRPVSYAPRAGHVAMVSGSLGAGGGERQTITVVRRLLDDPRIKKLSLLVRSTHLRPNDDFFLPQMESLAVDLTVYGHDWLGRTDLTACLPELRGRPRLMTAIELLPHHPREEVARLCRLLWDQRPQAVHIWQDIPYAAVACALVGIPHFFIHRGSLAPDLWAQNENQSAVHFRPMRHIYRHLLQRPGFVLLNNSCVGCETDQTWLAWPTPAPFRVVYNAVDFAQLGEHTGRNMTLRRALGVPDDAPLVGGAFRIVPVKRPLYWIEAARQVRAAIPNAHFVIIGDGDMTEEVAAYASRHGFSAAMHLPGRVSNVGDWYRAMDLHLLTSEREGLPNAIIESQHFGVPVVATAVGGVHEAIDTGQTGYVVDGDNGPTPFAERVVAVLRDTAWHERARLKAPIFVHDKFNLDRVVDQLLEYYGTSGEIEGSTRPKGALSALPYVPRVQATHMRTATSTMMTKVWT